METQTPLWLGIIIIILSYVANILIKWIEVEKQRTYTGERFSIKFWWITNRLNVILSCILITLLLLVFPDVTNMFGDSLVSERVAYAIMGFAPYKLFKLIIPETYQGVDRYEDLKVKTKVKGNA